MVLNKNNCSTLLLLAFLAGAALAIKLGYDTYKRNKDAEADKDKKVDVAATSKEGFGSCSACSMRG